MRTIIKILLIGAAAYFATFLYIQSWRFGSLDPEKVTEESFSFSDFLAERWRRGPTGSDDLKDPVLASMRDTLWRLYPPGTDAQEFCAFLERVGERELNKANSIEDQSSFRPTDHRLARNKTGCGVDRIGRVAIAGYHFEYKFYARSFNPMVWVMAPTDGVLNFHMPLQDGKIFNLSITMAFRRSDASPRPPCS
jgi:hypothetical protein